MLRFSQHNKICYASKALRRQCLVSAAWTVGSWGLSRSRACVFPPSSLWCPQKDLGQKCRLHPVILQHRITSYFFSDIFFFFLPPEEPTSKGTFLFTTCSYLIRTGLCHSLLEFIKTTTQLSPLYKGSWESQLIFSRTKSSWSFTKSAGSFWLPGDQELENRLRYLFLTTHVSHL